MDEKRCRGAWSPARPNALQVVSRGVRDRCARGRPRWIFGCLRSAVWGAAFLGLFGGVPFARAQAALADEPGVVHVDSGTRARDVAVAVGYYGELLAHPGAVSSIELRIAGDRVHCLSASASLGGYRHAHSHLGVFFLPELSYRLTASFGLFTEVAAGVGYHRSLADGPTYRRVDGAIEQVAAGGQSTLLTSAGLGLGWDFSRRASIPIRLFTRGQVSFRYPYNRRWLPGVAITLGLAYLLPWSL